MAGIKPIKLDRGEPEIIPIEKVRALLSSAESYKDGVILPYVAIGLFAGIRPTELSRISWKNIDLDDGTITLDAKIAKMRGRRVVDMVCLTEKDQDGADHKLPANLIDWLLPYAPKKTPIRGKNWRRDFDAVKRLAGYDGREEKKKDGLLPWTQDLMRHTAISNHLAMFKHEGQTAVWAGNSPDVIQQHYKGLVKSKDAEEFWGIRPDADEKISKLPNVA